jgi:hypothetical protein
VGTVEVPLRGKWAEGRKALIGQRDAERVLAHNWWVMKNGYVHSRRLIDGREKKFLMHRFILGIDDRKVFVDHRDDDRLNNTRSNLALCTNKQNVSRKRKFRGTSRFKGPEVAGDDRAQLSSDAPRHLPRRRGGCSCL